MGNHWPTVCAVYDRLCVQCMADIMTLDPDCGVLTLGGHGPAVCAVYDRHYDCGPWLWSTDTVGDHWPTVCSVWQTLWLWALTVEYWHCRQPLTYCVCSVWHYDCGPWLWSTDSVGDNWPTVCAVYDRHDCGPWLWSSDTVDNHWPTVCSVWQTLWPWALIVEYRLCGQQLTWCVCSVCQKLWLQTLTVEYRNCGWPLTWCVWSVWQTLWLWTPIVEYWDCVRSLTWCVWSVWQTL